MHPEMVLKYVYIILHVSLAKPMLSSITPMLNMHHVMVCLHVYVFIALMALSDVADTCNPCLTIWYSIHDIYNPSCGLMDIDAPALI